MSQIKLSPEESKVQQQGQWVQELTQMPGWKEVLRPWLEDKIRHAWVDPRKVKSDQDLLYEYKVAWAFARASEEILQFVEKVIDEASHLTKKEKGEITDPLREAVS